MMKGGWLITMKAWVKTGLDTLNVSMTMNNNVINNVIVSTAEVPTNQVETPISEENNSNALDGINAMENASSEQDVGNPNNSNESNEPIERSQDPIVENESEAPNETETEQKTDPTDPLLEEENCIVDETSTESKTNGLFSMEEELFNDSNQDISEEFQIEGGCSTVLMLGGEKAEEMEKAIADLIS